MDPPIPANAAGRGEWNAEPFVVEAKVGGFLVKYEATDPTVEGAPVKHTEFVVASVNELVRHLTLWAEGMDRYDAATDDVEAALRKTPKE